MRVLIFLGLKILEIGGVVFVPYWLGRIPLIKTYFGLPVWFGVGYWIMGVILILGIIASMFMACLLGAFLTSIIQIFLYYNWEKAGRIVEGRKK